MTKANSNLHRAAALLAALCLLASMTLPVYAAGAEAELSASNSETIPDNDNTENDANGTGADASVSNLETIQKDGDTTSEGSKTDPEISAPDSGTIPGSTGTTDKAAGATLAEGVTGSENTAPAGNAAAGKTTDADNTGEDSTGSEDEAGFLNEGDSADDRMLTAGNAKESLCADDNTVPQGTKYTFYFAPPDSWKDSLSESSILTCSFMRGNDNSPTPSKDHEVRETTAQLITDKTTDGRSIYQVDVYHDQGKENSLCPYGGFVWVKFTLDDDHCVKMMGQSKGGNDYWMEVGKIANRCLDGNKLEENTENVYDYDIDKWVPYADITPKHVRYCRQKMVLLNKSAQALDSVTVTFWEKDDKGDFTQVGTSQTINTLQAGDHADIKIPETACAYVSFKKSDDTYIGGKKYFNFYNDETETKDIAVFPYDPVTRYCLIYTGKDDVRWSAPGSKTVYFDATFSDMSYNNDGARIAYGMPDANGNLWCYITSDVGGKEPITKLQMVRDGTSEIWYVDVPQGYTKIRFASWAVDNDTAAQNGDGTAMLTIPADKDKPCFYADTSDDVIYQGGNRGGYWDELGKTRDAETGKKQTKQTVVDITQQPFQNISGVKYISSTLYDYYTDFELNGNNRDDYDKMDHGDSFKQQRNWVTFRQFDRTISDYYNAATATNKPNYPIYTGHFQSDEAGDWPLFSDLADTLDLYGWDYKDKNGNVAYRKFMATNNSNLDAQPSGNGTGKYYYTMLGLVADQLSGGTANGDLIMSGTTDLLEPHFNEAFLKGDNSRNAKIGEVYHNVLFPFTKNTNVFADQPGVDYWWFDSSKTSLYMRQDPNTEGYYLGNKNTDSGKITRSEERR